MRLRQLVESSSVEVFCAEFATRTGIRITSDTAAALAVKLMLSQKLSSFPDDTCWTWLRLQAEKMGFVSNGFAKDDCEVIAHASPARSKMFRTLKTVRPIDRVAVRVF